MAEANTSSNFLDLRGLPCRLSPFFLVEFLTGTLTLEELYLLWPSSSNTEISAKTVNFDFRKITAHFVRLTSFVCHLQLAIPHSVSKPGNSFLCGLPPPEPRPEKRAPDIYERVQVKVAEGEIRIPPAVSLPALPNPSNDLSLPCICF